jgi:hypothetical protein
MKHKIMYHKTAQSQFTIVDLPLLIEASPPPSMLDVAVGSVQILGGFHIQGWVGARQPGNQVIFAS